NPEHLAVRDAADLTHPNNPWEAESEPALRIWVDGTQNTVARHRRSKLTRRTAVPDADFGQPTPSGGVANETPAFRRSRPDFRRRETERPLEKMDEDTGHDVVPVLLARGLSKKILFYLNELERRVEGRFRTVGARISSVRQPHD